MSNIIEIKGVRIGDGFCVIAGPCAIESKEQLFETTKRIKDNISILRGGAYKPRTHHNSFQGLKGEGLKILQEASQLFDIPTVTEVVDVRDVEEVARHTDILQVGARNMQNFPLLIELGKTMKPILLKRGHSNTISEWIAAAEYIAVQGNRSIIMCERGIRTFEKETRFTMDIAGAILVKQRTDFPVIIDPSHATGHKSLIGPLAFATKAGGLDGVMIEVHKNPAEALCDGDQSLTPEEFNGIINNL